MYLSRLSYLLYFIAYASLFFSCSSLHSSTSDLKSFSNRYSLDQLPEQWKKPATLKTINDILPVAVNQLKGSKSCMNCKGGFTITVQLDSLYILSQTVVDKSAWDSKNVLSNSEDVLHSWDRELVTTFRFKSHLAISDSMGRQIVHLLVVDPLEDIYTIQANTKNVRERPSSIPIVFLTPNFIFYNGVTNSGLLPTNNELLDFTKQKLKTVRERLMKLSEEEM